MHKMYIYKTQLRKKSGVKINPDIRQISNLFEDSVYVQNLLKFNHVNSTIL